MKRAWEATVLFAFILYAVTIKALVPMVIPEHQGAIHPCQAEWRLSLQKTSHHSVITSDDLN